MKADMSQPIEISPVVVVVDLETLATSQDAVIGTIGAVARNLLDDRALGTFYQRIDLALHQPRRYRDAETTAWWKKQEGSLAWRELFDPALPRVSLELALTQLADWMGEMKAHCPAGSYLQVMGNGCEFDNVILADAFEQFAMPLPWQFRANQSLRTAVWLGRLLLNTDPKYAQPFLGEPHYALDDARHEAETLQAIVNLFRYRLGRAAR